MDGVQASTGPGGQQNGFGVENASAMPTRKRLNHRGPLSIDVTSAWYFITICAAERVQYGVMVNAAEHDPHGRVGVPSPTAVGADVVGADGDGTPSLPADVITVGAAGHAQHGRVGVPSPTAVGVDVVGADGDGTPSLPGVFMPIADEILECARQYHLRGRWRLELFLVMPDHLHFIVRLPVSSDGDGTPSLPGVMRHWKHYVSEHYGVLFQKDFWDTRLRDDAHIAEKFRYICNNPVRKGLCATARDWQYVIAFDRDTGVELNHK